MKKKQKNKPNPNSFIANEDEDENLLDAQCKMLERMPDGIAPKPVGKMVLLGRNWVRMLTYVQGKPLGSLGGSIDFIALGSLAGRVALALSDMDLPCLHRNDFQWDLACYETVIDRNLPFCCADDARTVSLVRDIAHSVVSPRVSQLVRQAIHNDLNSWNVLLPLAVIDFGDALCSWRVNEIAIMAAYAMLLEGAPSPISVCQLIAQGYETQVTLNEAERACLLPLAALRLCTSAVVTAVQTAAQPENTHLSVYYVHVKRVLPLVLKLLQSPPWISIRPGTLDDEPCWLRGVREVLALEGTIEWSQAESATQSVLWRRYCANGTCAMAVDAAGHVAGFVTWERGAHTPYTPPECATPRDPPFIWVNVSYTSPTHRRQGICKAMYTHLAGGDDLELDVYESNKESISFHERIGFRCYACVFRRKPLTATTKSQLLLRGNTVLDEQGFVVVGTFSAVVTNLHPFGISYGEYAYPFVFLSSLSATRDDVIDFIISSLDEMAARSKCPWVLAGFPMDDPCVQHLKSRGFNSYVKVFRRSGGGNPSGNEL